MKFEALSKAKLAIVSKSSRAALICKKHSPAILLGVGVAGVVTGTVMACRETLKLNDILEDAKDNIDKINLARENEQFKDKYTEEDAKHDKKIIRTRTAVKVVKNYLPSAGIMVASIVAILASYKILSKRNAALVAAYNSLKTSFDAYRRRVVKKYGADEDKKLFFGIDEIQSTLEKLENESEGTIAAKVDDVNAPWYSEYAKFFDASSPYWDKSSTYNKAFLIHQQSIFNEKLNRKGHVFLNEVYDALGIDRTQAGSIVGWLKNGNGNGFIDFGIFNSNEATRRAVNGSENVWLLDFNVDGVIYDKIGSKF